MLKVRQPRGALPRMSLFAPDDHQNVTEQCDEVLV